MSRICKKCGLEKPKEEFRFRRGYFERTCKVCSRAKTRQWQREHAEHIREKERIRSKTRWKENAAYREHQSAAHRKRYRECPEYRERVREAHRRSAYGLEPEKYAEMLKTQEGKCAACKIELVKPRVDHCHTSGKVRGLLCNRCNVFLGFLEKHSDVLPLLENYLRKFKVDVPQ